MFEDDPKVVWAEYFKIPFVFSQTAFEDALLMPPKSLSASEAIKQVDALLGGKLLAHCLVPPPPSFSDRFYARWQAAVEYGKQQEIWAADRDLRMNAGRN